MIAVPTEIHAGATSFISPPRNSDTTMVIRVMKGHHVGRLRPLVKPVLRFHFMPTDHILALLIAERDKLNRAIEALGGAGTKRRGRPRKNHGETTAAIAPAQNQSNNHHMRSPEARKAQARRMKLYWAKRKKQEKK
jgi:hypothetical protein